MPNTDRSRGGAGAGGPSLAGRKGAALALATAAREVAIEALVTASRDAHLDVRKAAAGSLSGWARDPTVSVALKTALDDSDADVRAIARQALRAGCPER
ncbi:MAG: HEAT repeat domain-containing protein [Actinobacteria bacterium]|nr:HEAT repeat domain-containing protein [Actinomycetota bacterium]